MILRFGQLIGEYNITLCEAQNITNNLPLRRFYAIIHLKVGDCMNFEITNELIDTIKPYTKNVRIDQNV